MMTVKQISRLTGVSVRTLQFYDEIDLLKPVQITDAGYRLYDNSTLEALQQILFFKELDFTLKEIKTIMDNPQFDRTAAFVKQRELIQLKRDRLSALLELLDKLIRGENCMDFKDFSMDEYFRILAEFKKTHTDDIVKQMGSIDNYDAFIMDLKSREKDIADLAVKVYGSIENYTQSMQNNFRDFLSHGPSIAQSDAGTLIAKTEALTKKLTENLSKDPASSEIQTLTDELVLFTNECNKGIEMGENYWQFMAETYQTNPVYIEVNDRKYGMGASKFIGQALEAYLNKR